MLSGTARKGPVIAAGAITRARDAARWRLTEAGRREQQGRSDEVRRAIGELQVKLQRSQPAPASLQDTEFQVFSQWGEDGAIAFLVDRVPLGERVFVEIGVHDYTESNTRFLAHRGGWRGVIVDAGGHHESFLRDNDLGWRADVEAVTAFVTAENVDDLLTRHGASGDIALLSLDIDGVDYWVLEALTAVRPRVLVLEFNSMLGPDLAVTVPYAPRFVASENHWSGQAFGASLAALHALAARKGYQLVGVESHGVNAFFVRRDVADGLWDLTPQEAYVRSRIRTARLESGELAYDASHERVLRDMRDVVLHDVTSGQDRRVSELYGL